MAEYICRDDIVLHYDELAKIDPNDFVGMAKYFAKQIRALPAADVEPVRHGEWAKSEKFHGYLCCSLCNNAYISPEWLIGGKWSYCPNCGAKMDEGVE